MGRVFYINYTTNTAPLAPRQPPTTSRYTPPRPEFSPRAGGPQQDILYQIYKTLYISQILKCPTKFSRFKRLNLPNG